MDERTGMRMRYEKDESIKMGKFLTGIEYF
jgi:hypothetical protein